MRFYAIVFSCAAGVISPCCLADDLVEFLDGNKLEGTIEKIRSEDREFDFVGNDARKKTYSYELVHAVTYRGKRYEFNPLPHEDADETGRDAEETGSTRSRTDVLKLIATVGSQQPDWYDAVQLNYPDSLDLTWPQKAEGGWNNQKNVGQYIWDVVNPNESRWRSGIKLVHHCMTLHKSDPMLLQRDMKTLGSMYFKLLQDYPRAAFWLQKVKPETTTLPGIRLAECYWRLGNKEMALSMMRGRSLNLAAVKLLGDMGEVDDAVRVAEYYASTTAADEAFLAAGDSLRKAGQLDRAIEYYTRILDDSKARNEDYTKRYQERAKGSIESIRLYDTSDVSKIADGTYKDSSVGYNGKVFVEVVVKASTLESVRVTKHNEKQFYAAITDTTGSIVEKQSIQGIDGTSGATITSQAILHATAKAMAQGSR